MKKIISLLILALPLFASSQKNDSIIFKSLTPVETLEKGDSIVIQKNKIFRFGFTLGINEINFNINNYNQIGNNPAFHEPVALNQDIEINNNSCLNAQSNNLISAPGIKIGFISELKLNDNMGLRFIPGIIFWEKTINFNIPVIDINNPSLIENYYKVSSTFLDFPFLIKYNNIKYWHGKPYIVFGGSYQRNISESSKEDIIRLSNYVLNAEIGIGLDKYFKLTRYSIELKASVGLNNILMDTSTPVSQQKVYSQSIKSIKSNMVTLSFMFD